MTFHHLLERRELTRPFWRYFEAFDDEPHAFLLDSASAAPASASPSPLARHSFLGADPFLVVEMRRSTGRLAAVTLRERGRAPKTYEADAASELRRLLAAHAIDVRAYAARPAPFLAGAVGWLGYECSRFFSEQPLPDRASTAASGSGSGSGAPPDVALMFVDAVLVHCHATGATWVSASASDRDERVARASALAARDRLFRRLDAFERRQGGRGRGHAASSAAAAAARTAAVAAPPRSPFDAARYGALVDVVREHIAAGDAYEVCLTHRFEAPFGGSPRRLHEELRRVNPAPFAGVVRFPCATVTSSSPERFLRVDDERAVESRPIKGTRRRGATPDDDDRARAGLASSDKDLAENTMIVDLVRNDLGRVCKVGSVHVPELHAVESYATVFQMVSTVRGRLDDGRDAIDLLRACFPGGSMTGAPKIAAMKIIDRLEPVERGVYSGAMGWFDLSGSLDLAMVIRSFVVSGERASFGVGGAVVADSDPRGEYDETLDKARALVDALASISAA